MDACGDVARHLQYSWPVQRRAQAQRMEGRLDVGGREVRRKKTTRISHQGPQLGGVEQARQARALALLLRREAVRKMRQAPATGRLSELLGSLQRGSGDEPQQVQQESVGRLSTQEVVDGSSRQDKAKACPNNWIRCMDYVAISVRDPTENNLGRILVMLQALYELDDSVAWVDHLRPLRRHMP